MIGPTPLWYTTRGAGMVLLIFMTVSVVLGILTTSRWGTAGTPRLVTSGLHRNLSLLTLVFLALHIVTAIADSFAHLGLRDAVIPFVSAYRPIWLGVGVLGAELFVAVVITSLLRRHLGYQLWRLTHWVSYASWPLALVHGLGTGSDTRAGWALALTALCVFAVLLSLAWRLAAGAPRTEPVRLAAVGVTTFFTVLLVLWMIGGPLKSGWAVAAGTPCNLISVSPSNASNASPTSCSTP
ncbi:MAG TPA: ferric reductase-like transmembrane domain-containing protein [Candidatus Dormibacteraeota bacterium]